MLVPNKMQHVVCTGNIGSQEQYAEIRNLAPNVHVVSGDFELKNDEDDVDAPQIVFPETKVLKVGDFRIGVIHGHQIIPWGDHLGMAMMRRKLDVDILITGHTHKNEVIEQDGYFHINPVCVKQLIYYFANISGFSNYYLTLKFSGGVNSFIIIFVTCVGINHRGIFILFTKCFTIICTFSSSGSKSCLLRVRIKQWRSGCVKD